ncbi:MAG: aminotransferase class V-fold PLP-dependent enzyme [Clostridia bacterium]|nr:aminotransferase class V-fold PLP-dependent enzyme [Clostridia bacterium]
MIYFDNAASGGRKPDCVQSAVCSAIKVCANPGRSGHKLALACALAVQDTRKALNDFLGGYGFDRVAFTKNCTEALNIALFGVLKKGDHVVTTPMEHNSVLRPLEALKRAGVITYDVCPISESGNVTPQAIAALVKSNTRLVAVTTASNVTGAKPPLKNIRAAIPKSVLFLCDGAQGGGHFSIDMRGAGIDLLTLAGHKGLMAIQGSGALLFSDRVNPKPLLWGGTGSVSVELDMPDFYPDALEAGTVSYPAILSLLEGVRYLTTQLSYIQERTLTLTAYLIERLGKMREYRLFSVPNESGIVAFSHARLQSEYIAGALSSRFDIAVRGGLHCAPLMHQALGTLDNGLVRVSFSHFNDEAEIDELLSALEILANEPLDLL